MELYRRGIWGKRILVLCFISILVAVGLLWPVNPYAQAEEPTDRSPTYSSTHGTATAEELAAAMDIPADLIVSASIGTSDPKGANVFAGDGTFTGFKEPTITWDPAHENNFKTGRTKTIDSIVIHYSGDSFLSCINQFKNKDSGVSAHYVISRQGNITQMVKDEDTAYHATYYNPRSIGIELEGSGSLTDYTPAMYRSLANLINYLKLKHPNIPLNHPKGKATKDSATGDITCLNVAGVVGHEQVQPFESTQYLCLKGTLIRAKVDPGPNFDWNRLFFAALSSGNAADALTPNTSGSLSTVLEGLNNSQGNDLVQLTLALKVPPNVTHWAVDWKFLSEEFPEWVGTQYNDAFLIETPLSNFTISGFATINAPNNVALDQSGNLVSVNTTGVVGMSAVNAAGTTYDGATATLTTSAPIPTDVSTITIVFSVMDLGDSIYDTTVFLDKFRFITPLHVLPMETNSFYAFVPPDQVQAIFSTSWFGSDVVMSLTTPSGDTIDRDTVAPNLVHELGPNYESYTITNPEAGDWLVNLYGADVPLEGEEVVFILLFSTVPPINQSPVADAGPDQTVERTSALGAEVMLDGSGSYDPDNGPQPLSYSWTWAGGSASEVSPAVVMPMGTTVVTLEVSDGALTDTDTVAITVQDTTPPVVTVVFPTLNLAVQEGVTLTASASDLSGVAAVYFYVREPDGPQGKPIAPEFEDLAATLNGATGIWEYNFDTLELPDGYYVILAKGVDTYDNEGWSDAVPFSIRNWAVVVLLPATESNKAGRTMPVKFSLRVAASVDPKQPFVYNEDLTIKIFATSNPGNILQTSTFGSGARDYRIDTAGQKYITNFQTSKTPMQYTVSIYRGTFLVGSFTFKTVK